MNKTFFEEDLFPESRIYGIVRAEERISYLYSKEGEKRNFKSLFLDNDIEKLAFPLLYILKKSYGFNYDYYKKGFYLFSHFPFYLQEIAHEISLKELLNGKIVYTFNHFNQLKEQVENFFSINYENIDYLSFIDSNDSVMIYVFYRTAENEVLNIIKRLKKAEFFIIGAPREIKDFKAIELPPLLANDFLSLSSSSIINELEIFRHIFSTEMVEEFSNSLKIKNFEDIVLKNDKRYYFKKDKKFFFPFPEKVKLSAESSISILMENPELLLGNIKNLSLRTIENIFFKLPMRYKLSVYNALSVKTDKIIISLSKQLKDEGYLNESLDILRENKHLSDTVYSLYIEMLYENGEYKKAYELIRRRRVSELLKVKILRKLGKFKEALRIIEENGPNREFKIEKALILYAKGEFEPAERILKKIVENEPSNIDALRYLSYIERKKKRFLSSKKFLEKAYGLASKLGSWRLIGDISSEMGQIYFEEEEYDNSLRWFEVSKIYYEKANYLKGRMLSLFNIGETLKELGKFKESLKIFEEVLNYDVESGNRISLAIDYSSIGEANFFIGNFEKSLFYIEKALEIEEAKNIVDREFLIYLKSLISGNVKYKFKKRVLKELVNQLRDGEVFKIPRFSKNEKDSFILKVYFSLEVLKSKGKIKLNFKQPERIKKLLKSKFSSYKELSRNFSEKVSFEIIGKEGSLSKLFKLADKIKELPFSVLILGESGTGKEVVARYIHETSSRRDKPFIPVNCATLPESLLESILFGYKKGAFTGADEDRKGVIKSAEGGTVFLDEIGEMPYPLQAKLLRVLQEKEVFPLGSTKPEKVNVRFVFATNKDLKEYVKRKEFREDLYFRINEVTLELIPIRERKDEIEDFLNYFLRKYSPYFGVSVPVLSEEALEVLRNYSWYGNVREIESEVKKILLRLNNELYIKKEHISEYILKEVEGKRDYKESRSSEIATIFSAKERVEKETILKALKETGFNKTKTAKILGISRVYLYKLIKKYSIDELYD